MSKHPLTSIWYFTPTVATGGGVGWAGGQPEAQQQPERSGGWGSQVKEKGVPHYSAGWGDWTIGHHKGCVEGLRGQLFVSSPVLRISSPGEMACFLRPFSPVSGVLVPPRDAQGACYLCLCAWSAEAKTMEEKSRVELRAQNEVQLLVPGTKADKHLFCTEGCNLGPAGWLAPVPSGMGVPGSCVTQG